GRGAPGAAHGSPPLRKAGGLREAPNGGRARLRPRRRRRARPCEALRRQGSPRRVGGCAASHLRLKQPERNMAKNDFDVIVVGARCAGSPTAMLLARKGYKVLVVDKATFPSDTISTHLIHPPGVAALKRWGLLDQVVALGAPPIDTYVFDFGPLTVTGSPGTDEAPVAYGPRRTVLDKLLVDAASEAGAELREEFTVEELVIEDGRVTGIRGHGKGGGTVTDKARVVVGADGLHSLVSRTLKPDSYHERPP